MCVCECVYAYLYGFGQPYCQATIRRSHSCLYHTYLQCSHCTSTQHFKLHTQNKGFLLLLGHTQGLAKNVPICFGSLCGKVTTFGKKPERPQQRQQCLPKDCAFNLHFKVCASNPHSKDCAFNLHSIDCDSNICDPRIVLPIYTPKIALPICTPVIVLSIWTPKAWWLGSWQV